MEQHLFVLADGREIFSGAGADPAIRSVTVTRCVNEGRDLDYGSACAAMVEAAFLDESGTFTPGEGEMTLYRVDQEGNRTLLGHFLPEQPQKTGRFLWQVTAYDRMLRFDRDLTSWLSALTDWPCTMENLLDLVCRECGVDREEVLLPNGDRPVMRFLQAVTGRQILKWIAGANGAYAAITPEGKLTFRPYSEGGEVEYPIKSLRVSDFATAPIRRVTIRQTEEDVGVSWPEAEAGEEYTVLGNPLLASFHREELLALAKNIYEVVRGITYTPVTGEVFGCLEPGRFYTFRDARGQAIRTAVMTARYRPGLTAVESTGSPSRSGPTAQASKDPVKVVQGRILELRKDLTDLSVSLQETVLDLEGVQTRQTDLSMDLEGITGEVRWTQTTAQGLSEQISRVEQNSTALEISLGTKAEKTQVEEITRHFLFSGEGLTIRGSTGMGIGISEQQILFTGGSSATTEIRPDEMETTNLRVGSRLDLGTFSFFPRSNGNLSFRYTGVDENGSDQ